MAEILFKQISSSTSPDESVAENSSNALSIPYKFEEKFGLAIIHLGSYKIKQKMSFLLMPYFMIKINCNLVKRFAYETIIVGDEDDDVNKARENAFHKAYNVLRQKFRHEVLELERSYVEDEY